MDETIQSIQQPTITHQTPISLEFLGVAGSLLITLSSIIWALVKVVSKANEIKSEFALTDRDIRHSFNSFQDKMETQLNTINNKVITQEEIGRNLSRRVRSVEHYLVKDGYQAPEEN